MKILVTGSKGRLGSLVVKQLRTKGHSVVEFDRSSTISDLPTDLDSIIHLAANTSKEITYEIGVPVDREYIKDNIKLTNEIFKFAKRYKIPVYYTTTFGMFLRLDSYTISKAICDSLVDYYRQFIKIKTYRLTNVKYDKDFIVTTLKNKLKNEQVVVDSLDFYYMDSKNIVKQIINDVEGNGLYNIILNNKTNLYNTLKNETNCVKGTDKDYLMIDGSDDIDFKY
jgi:nucleoside-diphosphate-sugar epimerase